MFLFGLINFSLVLIITLIWLNYFRICPNISREAFGYWSWAPEGKEDMEVLRHKDKDEMDAKMEDMFSAGIWLQVVISC